MASRITKMRHAKSPEQEVIAQLRADVSQMKSALKGKDTSYRLLARELEQTRDELRDFRARLQRHELVSNSLLTSHAISVEISLPYQVSAKKLKLTHMLVKICLEKLIPQIEEIAGIRPHIIARIEEDNV